MKPPNTANGCVNFNRSFSYFHLQILHFNLLKEFDQFLIDCTPITGYLDFVFWLSKVSFVLIVFGVILLNGFFFF